MPIDFDFRQYESEMAACLERSVLKVMNEWPDDDFYAAALHEFYAETGDQITLPHLAVNTSGEVDQEGCNRWSTPDWYWDDLEFASKKLLRLHSKLESEASQSTLDHWDKVYSKWMDTLIRVAKELTKRLKKHQAASKDFGFYLFDDNDEDGDLLRRCMSPAKFRRLFPSLQAAVDEKKRDTKLPAKQKLSKYEKDLYSHQDEILELGKAAVPILIRGLDEDESWLAADLLAKLGASDAKVIRALRSHACLPENASPRWHFTSALAILGDIDFVLELAKSTKTRDAAIRGIKALYSERNHGFIPVPLDYSPLERLLNIKSCSRKAQRPCSDGPIKYALDSRGDILPADVDIAIAGTASKYKMIREHAVDALGNRSLGKAASGPAMQAITNCFNDRAMTVRFLALCAIKEWKKAAKEHLLVIRRVMRNDTDPDVRYRARMTIKDMGFKP